MRRLFSTLILSTASILVLAAPSGSKPVIVQMFEWTWNSVATECTSFLGPAGYGFVQGPHSSILYLNSFFRIELIAVNACSEPSPRTHQRVTVVDGLSACLVQYNVEAGNTSSIL